MIIWKSQSSLLSVFPNGREDIKRKLEFLAQTGIRYYTFKPFGTTEGACYKSSLVNNVNRDLVTPILEESSKLGIEARPTFLPFHWFYHLNIGQKYDSLLARMYQPGGVLTDVQHERKLCSSWNENIEVALRLLEDFFRHYDFPGLHLDAIRYMHSRRVLAETLCQCEACQCLNEKYIGKKILSDEDLQLPGIHYQLLQYRITQITKLLSEIRQITKRKGIPLSIDAKPDIHVACVHGQNWAQWARDDLVDDIVTMNYATQGHVNNIQTQRAVLAGTKAKLYDGIGLKWSGGETSVEQMIQFADQAKKLGCDGIKIYSADPLTQEQANALLTLSHQD